MLSTEVERDGENEGSRPDVHGVDGSASLSPMLFATSQITNQMNVMCPPVVSTALTNDHERARRVVGALLTHGAEEKLVFRRNPVSIRLGSRAKRPRYSSKKPCKTDTSGFLADW
jgi:hypothetical protein